MPVLEAQIRQPGDEDWLDVEFDVVGSLVTIRAGGSVLGEYSTTDISWGGEGPFLMTVDDSTLSVRPADTDAFRRTLVNASHPEASDSSIRPSETSRVPDIASIIVVVLAAIVGAVLISGDHPFRDRAADDISNADQPIQNTGSVVEPTVIMDTCFGPDGTSGGTVTNLNPIPLQVDISVTYQDGGQTFFGETTSVFVNPENTVRWSVSDPSIPLPEECRYQFFYQY